MCLLRVRAESLNVTHFHFHLSRVNVACINIHDIRAEFQDCDATNVLVKAGRLKTVQSVHRVCARPYIENPACVATTMMMMMMMMMMLNTTHN